MASSICRAAPLRQMAYSAFAHTRTPGILNYASPCWTRPQVLVGSTRVFKRLNGNTPPQPLSEVPPTEAQRERMERTLFINGLPFKATNTDLRKFLASNDIPILRVIRPVARFKDKNPGFAFVELPDKSQVADAIAKFEGKYLDGRKLEPVPSAADPELFIATAAKKPQWYFQDFERDITTDELMKPDIEGRRIIIRGFPLDGKPSLGSHRSQLIALLSAYDVEAMSKVTEIKKSRKGGKWGYVFIETSTREEADRIISECNRKEVLGGTLRVERLRIPLFAKTHGGDGYPSPSSKGLDDSPEGQSL